MNKVLMFVLSSAFILTGASYAQTPPPAAPPATAEAPVAVKPAHMDHHPEIHKALRKLKGAKADLEKAAHDYGGHRVAAIGFINQAEEELKAALATTDAH